MTFHLRPRESSTRNLGFAPPGSSLMNVNVPSGWFSLPPTPCSKSRDGMLLGWRHSSAVRVPGDSLGSIFCAVPSEGETKLHKATAHRVDAALTPLLTVFLLMCHLEASNFPSNTFTHVFPDVRLKLIERVSFSRIRQVWCRLHSLACRPGYLAVIARKAAGK